MSEPVLIGLCGRSGTGKGYVCRKFAAQGIPSVDTDAVYRTMTGPAEALSPCMIELRETFGDGILLPDRSLDRRHLSAIVFADHGENARQKLNQITHKHILSETMRLARQYRADGAEFVVIDAPLLFESGFDAFCRFTVGVIASEETSVQRILARDGVSEEEARRRLASQLSNAELLTRCDYRIFNDRNADDLEKQVQTIVSQIRACLRKDGAL